MIYGYVSMTTARALALVTGGLDTIPLWDTPPDDAIGQRLAIFAAWLHMPELMNLGDRGVRFGPRDLARKGRLGSVELVGWLRTESHLVRKRIGSKNWPRERHFPRDCAPCHWLVKSPKIEVNASIVGLKRIGMSYAERPEVIQRVREYAERFGASA